MKKSITLLSLLSIFNFCTLWAQNKQEIIQDSSIVEKIIPTEMFRYYFYPNLDAYFDRKTSEYIFKKEGQWVKELEIPQAYRGYSIYNNYKVEIADYKGETPYENLNENKKKYPYYSNDRKGKLAAMKAKTIADND